MSAALFTRENKALDYNAIAKQLHVRAISLPQLGATSFSVQHHWNQAIK
jgi:hypothetical protein